MSFHKLYKKLNDYSEESLDNDMFLRKVGNDNFFTELARGCSRIAYKTEDDDGLPIVCKLQRLFYKNDSNNYDNVNEQEWNYYEKISNKYPIFTNFILSPFDFRKFSQNHAILFPLVRGAQDDFVFTFSTKTLLYKGMHYPKMNKIYILLEAVFGDVHTNNIGILNSRMYLIDYNGGFYPSCMDTEKYALLNEILAMPDDVIMEDQSVSV